MKNICKLREDFFQDLDKISLSKAMNLAQRSVSASFIVLDFFALVSVAIALYNIGLL